ncbi:MAG: methylated-DNA--[protein]-cysteine S-methyltransferase [Eubacteriales bacterium]|nr:methylated-DNA--[protein]-cysteine S-methyltransferase [Eubacteriales bacterium]
MFYTSIYHSPLGTLYFNVENNALTALWFEGQKYAPDLSSEHILIDSLSHESGIASLSQEHFPSRIHSLSQSHVLSSETDKVITLTRTWLDLYFSGSQPDFLPPMHPKGTAFREAVWKLLLNIPYGQTRTYGQLAAELAVLQGKKKMSAQAVGGAVGHNPISVIIPCHRVLGSDGSLTGYAAGVSVKEALLRLEGVF